MWNISRLFWRCDGLKLINTDWKEDKRTQNKFGQTSLEKGKDRDREGRREKNEKRK